MKRRDLVKFPMAPAVATLPLADSVTYLEGLVILDGQRLIEQTKAEKARAT